MRLGPHRKVPLEFLSEPPFRGYNVSKTVLPVPGTVEKRGEIVNIDKIDIVSSELIKVMISRRKEGRRAISVLWLY